MNAGAATAKIVSRDALSSISQKGLVLTKGVFDILHGGHLHLTCSPKIEPKPALEFYLKKKEQSHGSKQVH